MEYTTFVHRPELRRPILLVAFEGWNDAGEAASSALGFVADAIGAEPIGQLDPEALFDFQQTRPTVRIVDGERRIDWPAVEIRAGHVDGSEHDIVLVSGHEPNLRWRSFADEVIAIAEDLGVELLVTVGALLADVPHTRPVQVLGSASDPAIAGRLGLAPSRYEGPTGMLGVLGDAANRAGVPSISLWAALPHYVQASPNPRAALALLVKLRELLGIRVDSEELTDAAETFDETVAELIGNDPELLGYVERLEREADKEDEERGSLSEMAPEQLVAEVERFLRDQPGGSRS